MADKQSMLSYFGAWLKMNLIVNLEFDFCFLCSLIFIFIYFKHLSRFHIYLCRLLFVLLIKFFDSSPNKQKKNKL